MKHVAFPGPPRWLARLTGVAIVLAGAGVASAQERAPLEAAPTALDWLKIEGEARVRYETVDGQFRAGGAGGDQLLSFRTLVLAEADVGPVAIGLEVQDSRVFLDDAGTPLSTSIVNPFDILQAYVRFDLDGAFGQAKAALNLGRQTMDIGSRRVLERVEMANVIFAYTGAYWLSSSARGDELHLLYLSPVGRLPDDRAALGENEVSGDEEQWGLRLWGAHYRHAETFGDWAPGVWAEVFLYGLDERDTRDVATPNRDYLQPGFRIFRAPATGRVHFDIEGSHRSGSRRQTSAPSDVRDLDVNASMLYAIAGYTFDHAWKPRVAVEYYYSSGDKDPTDANFDRFERLFGGRRSDLGNTGIFGPLTPVNLSAPGFRVEIAPNDRLDARLTYKAASLATGRDAWEGAGVIDATGQSGRFIGHVLDTRVRYRMPPASLELEVGASAIINGEFAKTAPNASRQGDSLFGYVQLLKTF